MKNKDTIKELFSDKLGAYEAPVNRELWSSISAQIGVNAAATGSGLSLLAKGIIGVAAVGVIGVTTYFVVSSEDPAVEPQPKVVENRPETQPVIQDAAVGLDGEVSDNQSGEGDEATRANDQQQEEMNHPTADIRGDYGTEGTTQVIRETPVYQPKERSGDPIWVTKGEEGNGKTGTNKQTKAESNERETFQTSGGNNDSGSSEAGKEQNQRAVITLKPDAFTPNADGINDEFYIEYEGRLLDFQLVVMDSKNTVVFESKDPDFIWRGTSRSNEPVPDGKYVYIITARDEAGNPINTYSKLTIMRAM